MQNWIERVAQQPVDGSQEPPDICLIEVGGTVGDIESSVFLEALRQFQFRVGRENFCLIFVSLVPVLGSVGEQKTKPTQHGVKGASASASCLPYLRGKDSRPTLSFLPTHTPHAELRAVGLSPDVIICRSSTRVEESTREKISVFCHVRPSHVLSVHDVSNIYHVPIILAEQNLHGILRCVPRRSFACVGWHHYLPSPNRLLSQSVSQSVSLPYPCHHAPTIIPTGSTCSCRTRCPPSRT